MGGKVSSNYFNVPDLKLKNFQGILILFLGLVGVIFAQERGFDYAPRSELDRQYERTVLPLIYTMAKIRGRGKDRHRSIGQYRPNWAVNRGPLYGGYTIGNLPHEPLWPMPEAWKKKIESVFTGRQMRQDSKEDQGCGPFCWS